MKVSELIKLLADMPQDAEVVQSWDEDGNNVVMTRKVEVEIMERGVSDYGMILSLDDIEDANNPVQVVCFWL